MSSQNFVLAYVQACTGGTLGVSDCGPIWQLGIIATLVVTLVTALIVFRIRARTQSAPGAKAPD